MAYEIFTGQSLPRSGLRRQWRRVLIIGGAYSAIAGGLIVVDFPQVHGVLLLTVISTGIASL
ncbi:MAG: hypothetical protein AAF394_16560, partial [Planctomycetota bacterium]